MKTKLLLTLILAFTGFAQNLAPTQRDVETGNLTDQQKVLMESAPNAGYQQRAYDEAIKDVCGEGRDGYSEANCKSLAQGANASSLKKIMGMSSATMKGLAQVYTMFMGASGVGSTLASNEGGVSNACKVGLGCSDNDATTLQQQNANNKAQADLEKNTNPTKEQKEAATKSQNKTDAQNKKNGGEKKEQEDYCRFIPMGTEAIAMFQQKNETEFIQNTPSTDSTNNQQVEALDKQSRSHAARAKTAKIQFTGWGATSACYVAMMTAGSAAASPMSLAKLAGSTVLASYFRLEEKAHGEAKDIVDQIKSKFVGATKAGTCNPISDRDCYCSQPETQNDVTYCLPQIRTRLGQNSDYQLTCLTEDLVQDKQCACVQSDTCLDKTIKNNLESIHIPQPAAMALTPFFQMTKGTMKPGQTTYDVDSNSGKLFAMSKELLKEGIQVEFDTKSLNKDEKDALKELTAMGLPSNLAHALLSEKDSADSKKNEKKFASGRYNFTLPKTATAYSKNSNQMNFRGGSGINSKKATKTNEDFSSIMNKFKKKNVTSSGNDGSVIRFAEAASRSAQITKDKDTKLFDIISRRYQVSARKRLEIVE